MRAAAALALVFGLASVGVAAQDGASLGAPGRAVEPIGPPSLAAPPQGRAAPGAPPRSAAAPPVPQATDDGEPRFTLRGVALVADDGAPPAVAQEAVAAAAAAFIGRDVNFDDLEALRNALTRLYLDAGFVNSGVVLPEQTVLDGTVTYRAVHGRVGAVTVTGDGIGPGGLGELDPDFVRRRLEAATAARPFNIDALQRRLRILLDDRNVVRLRATVRPGPASGEADVAIAVDAAPPLGVEAAIDNDAAPQVGRARLRALAAARNLLGIGDQLLADVELSDGVRRVRASGDAPIGDGAVAPFAFLELGQISVTQPPLSDLDVETDVMRLGGGLRLRLLETERARAAMDVSVERGVFTSSLLGERFSFTPFADEGETRMTLVRVVHVASLRRNEATLAARSQITASVDAFGSTVSSGQAIGGDFLAWSGQLQAIARATESATVILRAQAQLASRALPPAEQIALGGRDTVRGFRRASLVGDDAYALSLEGRIAAGRLAAPGLTPPAHPAEVVIAPFFDVGGARRRGATGGTDTLAGAGVGALWSPAPGLSIAAYLAAPLRRGEALGETEALHVTITTAFP